MQTVTKQISDLVPYEKNPRNNEAAVEPVASSIREFGFRIPILIDSSGVIIAGHTRYKAALKLGLTEVPCIVADDLTPEQIKAFRIADNKTAEYSKWDFDVLAAEMDELQKAGFDLALTAFAQDAIDDILASLEPPREVSNDNFDEDINPDEKPFSQAGDIWLLDGHRVMCGDSTLIEAVAMLMDGKKADMVLTDPPYNVDYIGKTGSGLKIQNDNMSSEEYFNFLLAVHKNIYEHTGDGAPVYVFHADSEGANVRRAFAEAGLKLAQCCIWAKNSMVLGRQDYQWQHEPVLYGWKPTAKHRWYSDRSQTTLWFYDRPIKSEDHPTMKPIPLLAYPIQNSSHKGDIVLDVFGGSGSTLIACERTERTCYAMEIAPLYCDLIVRRYLKDKTDAQIKLLRAGTVIEFESISQQFRF